MDRSWACRVLTNARFEVLPNITPEKVAEALPPGAKVTVTSSPKQGPEATIDLAAALAQRRFKVVPHLAARSIEGRAQVERMLKRMASLGIDEAFVIGGDPERPAGPYSSALELLEEIASTPE
ncbi:MAG: 5,10-methylenetetrahydrofolate reductase, partial [Thermomicrobiaceae bacterium]|nr:5,10-methylenetetrahydrofolate reductase [Thermomicrobiaceae bacterium]